MILFSFIMQSHKVQSLLTSIIVFTPQLYFVSYSACVPTTLGWKFSWASHRERMWEKGIDQNKQQIICVNFTSIDTVCIISSPNPMFAHFRAPDKVRKINFNRLYLSYFFTNDRWDDSNKWLNIGFGEEICILEDKNRSLSGALRTPDKMCNINFNWHLLRYILAKTYIRLLVRIVSMRRF